MRHYFCFFTAQNDNYLKINNSFCFTALIARILHKKQLLGNYPFSCL